MAPEVTRRGFLGASVLSGAAAALPLDFLVRAAQVAAAGGARFFTAHEYATCDAICSRIVPTDSDPGAAEARAVDFIDLFLAAFELPQSVADNPAIWLHGRWSGRNPYPDAATGRASAVRPASDFRDPASGQRHFLPLTRLQQLTWRAQLYGPRVLTDEASFPNAYRSAVRQQLIPAARGLRDLYRQGLAAFDDYSRSLFGADFAAASAPQQDAMLEAAGNAVVSNVPLPAPIGAPQAAKDLFGIVEVHTFQGTYGLPEYGGNRDAMMWPVVVWDGDTQPLGNSVYGSELSDADLGPGQGHNEGFGDPAVYQPRGGYREYRPVSTPGPQSAPLQAADIADWVAAMQARGVLRGGVWPHGRP